MDRARLLLPWFAALIGFFVFGWVASVPCEAAIIGIDQILVENDGNDYTNLEAQVEMSYDPSQGKLTVILTNISGLTSGPTAAAEAGNLLTGLGFSLPAGVDILNTSSADSSVSYNGSALVNTASFTQDDWGYSNSARGHFSNVPGVEAVNTTLSALSGDVFSTFGGGDKSLLHGVDYGLQSATGSAGPAGQAAIINHVEFTLYLSGPPDSGLLGFIDDHAVVASFGSPDTIRTGGHTPEPASFIVWFLIGLTWAGSAWTHQYRRRWQKWQREEALAAESDRGEDQAERLGGRGDDAQGGVALPTLAQFPAGSDGGAVGG